MRLGRQPLVSQITTDSKDPMPTPTTEAPIQPKLLYRVEEAGKMLSISRSRMFELLQTGAIRSVTEGRSRRIPHSALLDYVQRLEEEAI